MSRSNITVRLAGESGEGVISGGDILTSGAARTGYWAYTFRTYPAEIKGGPCMYQVRIGSERVLSTGDQVDLLVCFNQEGFDLNHADLADDGIIFADAESVKVLPEYEDRTYETPLAELAKEASGSRRGKNMVAIGTVCGLMGLDTTKIEELILKRYAHKGDVGESNIKALKAGEDFGSGHEVDSLAITAPEAAGDERLLLSGNQALSLGAVQAGLRYYGGYPITPASDILEWLAAQLPKLGGIALQTEDEIAALASVLGASYTGVKSMTATSGPGFSLMLELIGLAGMAEIPAVIVDVMRSGPSTGMPTKTEQSDLNQAVFGSHGEAPRVVMAPTSVEDCFEVIVEAFNIAEAYQVPVIILSDQSLSHRLETVNRPDLDSLEIVSRVEPEASVASNGYNRYQLTESGISPMSIPGKPGAYVSTGIEHDEAGHPQYEPGLRDQMNEKRLSKLEPLANSEARVTQWGADEADVGILGWGSTEGAAREASILAEEHGLEVAGFYPHIVWPLPVAAIQAWAKGKKRIVVPELNQTGQFARLVKADAGLKVDQINKADGLPFTAAEIFEGFKASREATVA